MRCVKPTAYELAAPDWHSGVHGMKFKFRDLEIICGRVTSSAAVQESDELDETDRVPFCCPENPKKNKKKPDDAERSPTRRAVAPALTLSAARGRATDLTLIASERFL
ncbi:hypothetical protein EVAR_54781_1 [Eumeta japonica]|uniref:Uncharacterized protein n=1 Tax=Eumeta variegata TaxID=151549 RepID=A0A4C1YFR3_EUMVA|nr:hypothetical protein EVAR_54781_1 [Eumeta japonica]